MNPNDVNNQWQFYAHVADRVSERGTLEIFVMAISLFIVAFAIGTIIRNWKIAKTIQQPTKNCAECQFDRNASNAIQDLNAKIGRDHEDFQVRQKHITEELERINRRLGEIKDCKNAND